MSSNKRLNTPTPNELSTFVNSGSSFMKSCKTPIPSI